MTDKPTITQADRDVSQVIAVKVMVGALDIEHLHQAFAKHRESAVAEAEREETCPICEGNKMGLSEGCYAGCRDGKVRWSSANVLKNIKLWWDSDRRAVAELQAEVERLRDALGWYGEQARLCRLIHDEGDLGRSALDADGGLRARAALAQKEPVE